MKKKTGYKEMLRDRCPEVVNWALLFCNAKTKWIEHVYENFIGIYPENDARHEATRAILGIGKFKRFVFERTILWDNLDKEESEYWTNIKDWVVWFQQNMLEIENEYYDTESDNKQLNIDILTVILERHGCNKENGLAKFLVERFNLI